MIKIVKYIFDILTIVLLLEIIFKSKHFSEFRIRFLYWYTKIEMSCRFMMEKYKFFYRIILEMIIIWFIFEWNDKRVISLISKWYDLFSKKARPLSAGLKEYFVFLSPYGRNILQNKIVAWWMELFSIGLFIVFIIMIISALLTSSRRLYDIFYIIIISFIGWYALLLSAVLISKIPQEYVFVCWALAFFLFAMIQITIIGIVSEE